jgi:aminopeptidase N
MRSAIFSSMKIFFLILTGLFSVSLKSQINEPEALGNKRNHVEFYHLNIEVDPYKKFISGKCIMSCMIPNYEDTLTFGLNSNYNVIKVLNGNEPINYLRKNNDILICPNGLFDKSLMQTITVYYEGFPKISKNPPWEGGFVWSKDASGNPFTGVVCELEGTGIWWPAYKNISKKPDSLLFSITVPKGLYAVSNGILQSTDTTKNRVCFNWFNPYPIANYSLTLYIGKYYRFSKALNPKTSNYATAYYSLNNNLPEAEMYFNQFDTLLPIFENYFGAYPFSKIGYKLVEAPYAGMEHQTAIAIGKQGKSIFRLLGYKTNIGYILVHETAHEWWGNSISIKSMPDLWINESLATYSESLFIEYLFGKEKAVAYINKDLEHLISNTVPIYDSNRTTFNHDIYMKGSAVWNTFRSLLNNDSIWFGFLKSINKEYKFKSISTPELLQYINEYFNTDFSYFFNQYIYSNKIPVLEIKIDKNNLTNFQIRWTNCNQDFIMPVFYNYYSEMTHINATNGWKTFTINNFNIEALSLLQTRYLIRTKISDY